MWLVARKSHFWAFEQILLPVVAVAAAVAVVAVVVVAAVAVVAVAAAGVKSRQSRELSLSQTSLLPGWLFFFQRKRSS